MFFLWPTVADRELALKLADFNVEISQRFRNKLYILVHTLVFLSTKNQNEPRI